EHVRRMIGRPLLQPWDPPFGRVRATGFFNSWLDQTDLGFGPHQLRHAQKRRVVGQPRIIVEEEQELTGDMRDPGVAPSWNSEVLWKTSFLTCSGMPSGSQPLPTQTMSSSTPFCARSDSNPRLSSSSRFPWLRTTTPKVYLRSFMTTSLKP